MAVINRNFHVFKGHKTLLGARYVTYGELELPLRYDIFALSNSFNWGSVSLEAQQLAFSMLYQVSEEEFAKENALKFAHDVVSKFNNRDWVISGFDILKWIDQNKETGFISKEEPSEEEVFKENVLEDKKESSELVLKQKKVKKEKKTKSNVVRDACKELGITQKELAAILQIPEGTVSSWAVKDEIPRLGKKAIEFYTQNQKNQKIIENYKNFVKLLD